MAKAEPLPDWAKVGAKFVTSDHWGRGMEIHTIARVTEVSAFTGAPGRQTRWTMGSRPSWRDPDKAASLVMVGGGTWGNTYGYWVESVVGQEMFAVAAEHRRRRELRKAFDDLYKEWRRGDALVLRAKLDAWLEANPEVVDDGAGQEV